MSYREPSLGICRRIKIFRRDNFTCQECGLVDKYWRVLEVHHVVPRGYSERDNPDFQETLCANCHKLTKSKPLPPPKNELLLNFKQMWYNKHQLRIRYGISRDTLKCWFYYHGFDSIKFDMRYGNRPRITRPSKKKLIFLITKYKSRQLVQRYSSGVCGRIFTQWVKFYNIEHLFPSRIIKPTKETLIDMFTRYTRKQICQIYNVSGKSLWKWQREYDIPNQELICRRL